MSRLKIITKYFIKNAFEEIFPTSKIKTGVMIVLMLAVVSAISFPFTIIIWSGYKSFYDAGQEGLLLAGILSIGASVSFLSGIYTIMNVLYFSDDIEVILPLPFKSSEIVFGKFIAVLINMYIYTAMLILPLIAYGVVSNANAIYYVYGIIIIIIIPIIPMILASLICMILMRFTSLSKHKDAFRMFTGCASLMLIVGFNFFTSRGNMDSEQILQRFSEGNNSLMNTMNDIFIVNKFSAYGLLYSNEVKGLLYIIMSLSLSIVLLIAYYYIGGKLYLKGIIGNSETYSKRENILENRKVDKLVKINSPIKALILKDIRILFRTPQFFINCIAMMLYMPAVMGVAFLSGENLLKFRTLLNTDTKWYGVAIVIAFIGATVCVVTGGPGATALSREGRDFIVSKYIPIDYKTLLYSKILSSLCISEFGTIIIFLALILVKANSIIILLGTISSFGSILLITLFGLYMDFKSPKLEWESEKAMLKNNYMSLFNMLIILILGGILVAAALMLKNYMIIFSFCMAIVLIGSGILFRGLIKQSYKVYKAHEN